jgi:hypothetical protein
MYMSEVQMPKNGQTYRIPEELLAEQWFSFVQDLIGGMQSAYREAKKRDPKLNQKVMAAKLGKKPSFVSRCLSGQTNMTIRTIHGIGRSMGYRLRVYWEPLYSLQPSNRQPDDGGVRSGAASQPADNFPWINTPASAGLRIGNV